LVVDQGPTVAVSIKPVFHLINSIVIRATVQILLKNGILVGTGVA